MSLDASDSETQSTAKIAPLITAVHTMQIIAGTTDPIGCPGRRPSCRRASERHLGSRQLESHLLVRPCPGRRRPSTIRMMPTMAMMSPMESHMRLPVMKLPGIRFMPCPANTPPKIKAITPTVIRAMRPVRLVTSPKLPSIDS